MYTAKQEIFEKPERIARAGLGFTLLMAGVSKFFIAGSWVGFEPSGMLEFLGLSSRHFTLLAGGAESLLGLWVLTGFKSTYSSLISFLWLFAVTVQVLRLGAWTLAIRDFGLTFYALTVLIQNWKK